MKIKTEILNHKNIKFIHREGTSDKKTFDEVIVRNVYEKKIFKILKNEHWIDLGGNVGAFALNAISKGATVDIYEPDPLNCKMIEKNLKLNNYNGNIINKAVVSGSQKKMTMYVGNNMQTWRNSLYKNWGNQKFTVECINFQKVIKEDSNVKMDIEGAEMSILEAMEKFPKKMVFEWSFDIDGRIKRYKNVIDKMKKNYPILKYSNQFYNMVDYKLPNYIFPQCDNIYCIKDDKN